MHYQVTETDVVARPTAVVAATTTWQEFPTLWRDLLDEVWTCLRAGGVFRGCRNVMLSWDDTPLVGGGVDLHVPSPLTGRGATATPPPGQRGFTGHRWRYAGRAA